MKFLLILINLNFLSSYFNEFQLKINFNCTNFNNQSKLHCLKDQFQEVIQTTSIVNNNLLINDKSNSKPGENWAGSWFLLDLTLVCVAQVTQDQINSIIERNQNSRLMGYLQCSNSCPVPNQLAFANSSNIEYFMVQLEDCQHAIPQQLIQDQVIIPISNGGSFNNYWQKLLNNTFQKGIDANNFNLIQIDLYPFNSNSLTLILVIILICFIAFLIIFVGCLVIFRHKPDKGQYCSIDIIDEYNQLYDREHAEFNKSLNFKSSKSEQFTRTSFREEVEDELDQVFDELSSSSSSAKESLPIQLEITLDENQSMEVPKHRINLSQMFNLKRADTEPEPESATIPKHFSLRSFLESPLGSPRSKPSSMHFPRMVAKVDPIPLPPLTNERAQPAYRQSTCSICFLDYRYGEKVRILTCGHTYHLDCIDQWLVKSKSSRCPLCHQDLYPSILGSDKLQQSTNSNNSSHLNLDKISQTTKSGGGNPIQNKIDPGVEIDSSPSNTLGGASITETDSDWSSTSEKLTLPTPHTRRYHKLNRSHQSNN